MKQAPGANRKLLKVQTLNIQEKLNQYTVYPDDQTSILFKPMSTQNTPTNLWTSFNANTNSLGAMRVTKQM